MAVAKSLTLNVVKNRASCPACESDDHPLQFYEETNSFFCHKSKQGGDCIELYVHINGGGKYQAAKHLKDTFGTATAAQTSPSTTPTRPRAEPTVPPRSAPAKPKQDAPFDPTAFAAKLQYTDEVEALGLTEAEAQDLGIGMHRGKLYIAMRYENGDVAGFAHGEFKLPSKLLPQSNVVALKRA